MSLEGYRDKLTRLRTGRSGPHERSHKPAFLLAIMSMVETGRLDGNSTCTYRKKWRDGMDG